MTEPRPPKGERRRKIITAAKKLFAASGYAPVTVDDIASAAGVTPAQFARSFDGKAALLQVICDELLETSFHPPAADGEDSPPDPLAQLLGLVESFLKAARARPAELRVLLGLLDGGAEEDAMAVVGGFLASVASAVEDVIREGQQAGVFRRSPDPSAAAREATRHLIGYAILAPFEGFAPADGEPPAQVIDLLLHGLIKTDV
jgi:AcrR family transcriptional regulator